MRLYIPTAIIALVIFLSGCQIIQSDFAYVNEEYSEYDQTTDGTQIEPAQERTGFVEDKNTPEVKATEGLDNNQSADFSSTDQIESIDPVGKLLSEMTTKIEQLKEDFTVEIKGLTQDDISNFEFLKLFPQLREVYWNGTFYGDYASIKISLKISMEHKIFSAYQVGRSELLSAEERQVLDVALNVINSKISLDMSDYEKELIIHDYIVMNCTYDIASQNNNTIPDTSYTSYGALVLGVAVCQGYSGAFKLFMDLLDIECDIITGQAGGESHAWNRVKIDGDYYLVDVTWNASIFKANPNNRVHYDFFNLTDEALNASHKPGEPQTKIATSTKYNYHYYNNLVVTSKEEFLAILRDTLDKGETIVYVLYENVDLREFIASQDIFQYLGDNSKILYSFSDKVNTLYLQFE